MKNVSTGKHKDRSFLRGKYTKTPASLLEAEAEGARRMRMSLGSDRFAPPVTAMISTSMTHAVYDDEKCDHMRNCHLFAKRFLLPAALWFKFCTSLPSIFLSSV